MSAQWMIRLENRDVVSYYGPYPSGDYVGDLAELKAATDGWDVTITLEPIFPIAESPIGRVIAKRRLALAADMKDVS